MLAQYSQKKKKKNTHTKKREGHIMIIQIKNHPVTSKTGSTVCGKRYLFINSNMENEVK